MAAVADRRADRREWLSSVLPESVAVYEEGSALIDSASCDAVLIAVPPLSAPGAGGGSLAKGLHVLCEKPAGVYTKQVREMNAAADRSGKVFRHDVQPAH